ncbi:MAG: SoxR reducing system RseC family protein [Clostridiales bacterium]|nr:SoxR reducing system RseC family protein [Clostridiales bacterium]
MTEQGVVLSVKDEFAKVRVGRNSACASCGKCGMTEKQKHVDFFASNDIGAAVGDTVSIEIPETNSAKFAFVAYCLPLIPALALLFLSIGLKWADWLSVILFIVGLAVGFTIVAVVDKLRKHKWMETPQILAVVGRKTVEQDKTEQGEQNNE